MNERQEREYVLEREIEELKQERDEARAALATAEADCAAMRNAADAEIAALRQQLDAVTKDRNAAIKAIDKALEIGTKESARNLADALGERDEVLAKLAASELACAAMREALDFYAENVGNCARFSDETGNVARARLAKDIGEKARAALTRPTGQAIMDELSAARKVCEALMALVAECMAAMKGK